MLTANNRAYVRKTIAALGVVALVAGVLGSPAQARADRLDRELRFEIPAQSLATALVQFSKQAEVQLVTSSIELGSRETAGISGRLSIRRALESLLDRTGLVYSLVGENTVAIGSSGGTPNSIAFPLSGSDSSRTLSTPQAFNNPETPEPGTAKTPGFWNRFRLAQNEPSSQADGSSSKEENRPQSSDKNPESRVIDEIVVTGSRLSRTAAESAQDVKIYPEEQIEQSGQNSLAGFLRTLPESGFSVGESTPSQVFVGASTVVLRGLPVGSTLVLINGRRVVSVSGSTSDVNFFDLNTVPLAAVERVEVLAEAGSAVYGSDAIGGVVNIILKKDFEGIETYAKYGAATEGGTDELNAAIAWGKRWQTGSLAFIGSYQDRSELTGGERDLTQSNDFTRFGGSAAFQRDACSPGNIYSFSGGNLPGLSSNMAGIPPGLSGTPSISSFTATAGVRNLCGSFYPQATLIPEAQRYGALLTGSYQFTESLEGFVELLASHSEVVGGTNSVALTGGATGNFRMAAANPFNPFGVDIGVSYLLTPLGRQGFEQTTDLYRPLIGVRGELFGDWHWEVATWGVTQDEEAPFKNSLLNTAAVRAALASSTAATALNPFDSDAPASPELLATMISDRAQDFRSSTWAANAFIRGPLWRLPAGSIEVVLGSEYDHDELHVERFFFAAPQESDRDSYAFFAEARVPLWAGHDARPALALSLAGRWDDYSDFGSSNTGQLGLEWRPWPQLLFRAAHGTAFRAPSLNQLNSPVGGPFNVPVTDPRRNNELVTVAFFNGGNPDLDPERARSTSVGFVWTAPTNLNVSMGWWKINLEDRVSAPTLPILTGNEDSFPGQVIRAPQTPTDIAQGLPGRLTTLVGTFTNFGALETSGIDAALSWHLATGMGQFAPRLAVTRTLKYDAALLPTTPITSRLGTAAFPQDGYALKWKGSATLEWTRSAWSVGLTGRYVDQYLDFGGRRTLGGDSLLDGFVRLDLRKGPGSAGTQITLGGVNLTNQLPDYSAFSGDLVGFDPSQSDIRGRFVYGKIAFRW